MYLFKRIKLVDIIKYRILASIDNRNRKRLKKYLTHTTISERWRSEYEYGKGKGN